MDKAILETADFAHTVEVFERFAGPQVALPADDEASNGCAYGHEGVVSTSCPSLSISKV
jgi:hypothetical protein